MSNTIVDAIKTLRESCCHILTEMSAEYHQAQFGLDKKKRTPITEWLEDNAEIWGNRIVNLISACDGQWRYRMTELVGNWIGITVGALKAEGLVDAED